jgi:hypothetical protein
MTPELCTPGGKPVMEVPGLSPIFPEITDGPVLVIVEPASTAKDDAVPRPTVAVAAVAAGISKAPTVTQQSALIARAPGNEYRRWKGPQFFRVDSDRE